MLVLTSTIHAESKELLIKQIEQMVLMITQNTYMYDDTEQKGKSLLVFNILDFADELKPTPIDPNSNPYEKTVA